MNLPEVMNDDSSESATVTLASLLMDYSIWSRPFSEKDNAYSLFYKHFVNTFEPLVARYRDLESKNAELSKQQARSSREEEQEPSKLKYGFDEEERRVIEAIHGLYEHICRLRLSPMDKKLLGMVRNCKSEWLKTREENKALQRRLRECKYACVHCGKTGNDSAAPWPASPKGLLTHSTWSLDFAEGDNAFSSLLENLHDVFRPLVDRSDELERENTRLQACSSREEKEEEEEKWRKATGPNWERKQFKILNLYRYSENLYNWWQYRLNTKVVELRMDQFRLEEENEAIKSQLVEGYKFSCSSCNDMSFLFQNS